MFIGIGLTIHISQASVLGATVGTVGTVGAVGTVGMELLKMSKFLRKC